MTRTLNRLLAQALTALLAATTAATAVPFGAPSVPGGDAAVQLIQQNCRANETPVQCAVRLQRAQQGGRPAQRARQPQAEQPARPRPREGGYQADTPVLQPQQPAARPRRQVQQPQAGQPARPRRQVQQPQAEQPARPRRQVQQPQAEQPARPRRQVRQPQAEQPARPRPREGGYQNDTPVLRPGRNQARQPAPSIEQPAAPRQRQARPARPAGNLAAPRQRPREGGYQADTPTLRPGVSDQADPQQPPRAVRRVPRNDGAAQQRVRRGELQPVTREQGRRIDAESQLRPRERRPRGAEVVREFGDRVILRFGDRISVESSERPRLRRDATEIYAEELSGGRVRETVVRPNGVRVVTIRNANGDILRRSRFNPDGREYVLVYVDEDDYDYLDDWRDPGLDLPPLVLDIPREEYILDARVYADTSNYGADEYYEFLDQPPVEDVERLYSVDEVKRSARIRQKTRRIDLDTITFEFGAATIPESEIAKLQGVAEAIQRILERNPAETFLIEGHTDAVGSEYANLALSDQRAESVANALTDVFEIPAENLSTQGYGEEFLKVQTEEPERENRRVAIRRITPLVAPVASAN